jgi:hypothetical protein
MRILPAQRRGRPAIGAARPSGPPIEIDGVAIDYIATSGRVAAGYVAQATGQSAIGTIGQGAGDDAIAASFAAAAAAYARADATAASDVVAPMPAARLSV